MTSISFNPTRRRRNGRQREYHDSQTGQGTASPLEEANEAQAKRQRKWQVAQPYVAVGLQTTESSQAPDHERFAATEQERVMVSNRDHAVELLDHYITLVMTKPGTRVLKVDSDTHAELAELIDTIIAAAVDEVKRRMKNGVVDGQ